MENNEELLKLLLQNKQEEPQNIKDFLMKFLVHWYWFMLAGFIGLVAAFLFAKYSPTTYQVNSMLLVKDDESKSMSLDNIFSSSPFQSDVKIENHIGVLTSFSLNYQALENLDWRVSWFRSMPVGDYDLYGHEPYLVQFDPEAFNLPGVRLEVEPLDDSHYQISVDSKTTILGVETEIQFEKQGTFGKPFENQYFSFVLQKAVVPEEGSYYFVFNDWEQTTLAIQNKLEVSSVNKNADLIQLGITGQVPAKAIAYLNELSQVYIEYGLQKKNQISDNTIRFIDNQLKDIVDTLQSTSDQFTEYRSNNKVFDLGTEASLVAEKLSELDSKRSVAKMQLEYYQNLQKYIQEEGDMKNMVIPSVVGISDQGLNSMIVKLSELSSKKEALSYSMHSKNPGVQMIDKEIEYIQKSLKENLGNLVFNAKNELKSLDEDIAEVNKQLALYPQTEQDMINIKRMVDLNNELYNFLLQRRAEAQITKASNVPDIDILDKARFATSEKIGPRKKLILLIGLMAGLAIPFLIILIKDFLDETIEDKEEVEKLSSHTVVADITHNKFKQMVPVIDYPRSILAESFRELRTSLEYLSLNEQNRVIGIHSMIPGEGKSFVSANLASIIAINNLKVVLVCADMRKPMIHKYFELNNHIGLSTYLIGKHSIDDILKPTRLDNMQVITAGEIPPNPVELLGSAQFKTLIDELKQRYDVILIDNSPLTLVTDGAITSKYTSSNLFIARHKYSTKGAMEMLKNTVKKNKMRNVGIVLNDINPKKLGNYAYKNGGYYRKAYGEGTGYFEDNLKKRRKVNHSNN